MQVLSAAVEHRQALHTNATAPGVCAPCCRPNSFLRGSAPPCESIMSPSGASAGHGVDHSKIELPAAAARYAFCARVVFAIFAKFENDLLTGINSHPASRPAISRWTWGSSLDFRAVGCRGASQTRPASAAPRKSPGSIPADPPRWAGLRPAPTSSFPLGMGCIAQSSNLRVGDQGGLPVAPARGRSERATPCPAIRPDPTGGISRLAWGASFIFE
jgi:hypothetical protein